jgi:competence protein ComEC
MNIREALRHVPLLRVFVPFALGICVHENLSFFIGNPLWTIVPFVFLFLASWLESRWRKAEGTFAVIFFLFFFTSGYFLWERDNNFRLYHYESGKSTCLLRVDDQPIIRENGFRCPVSILQVSKNDTLARDGEKLMAWFADTSGYVPASGSLIVADIQLNVIEAPTNLGEFDYKQYLRRKGIVRQAFIRNWQLVDSSVAASSGVLPLMARLRHNMSLSFVRAGLTGDRLGVAAALVLGDRNFLSADIQTSYSKSGVMHILAVSGMHVAMLYGFLLVILGFLGKTPTGSVLQSVIILLIVWAYSCLTGLSPSVLRSAVMFTFILIGKLFARNSHSINSLAVSAMFLLLFDANLLFDIGFQLSYLAVGGILVFYTPIRNLYCPNNFIDKYIWEIIAVSIAAQLSTTPLALYYFHQFPNLFILANLIAIPASSIAMIAALLLLLFTFWHWLAFYLGIVLSYSLDILNGSVVMIDQIPMSVSQNVWITTMGVWLIYFMLISGAMFYFARKTVWLYSFMVFLVFVCVERSYVTISRQINREVVYFSVKNNVAASFSVNGSNYLITSMDSLNVYEKLIPYTKNYWAQKGSFPKVIRIESCYKNSDIQCISVAQSASLVTLSDRLFLVNKLESSVDTILAKQNRVKNTNFTKVRMKKKTFQTVYQQTCW